MKKFIKKAFESIIVLFVCIPTIKATPIEIMGDSSSIGNNSECKKINGYIACYDPAFRFRITMVDEYGNKVKNTNSVDFTIVTNSSEKTTVLNKNEIGANLAYNNFKYKYGENTGEFKFIKLYIDNFNMKPFLADNGRQTMAKYNPFMEALKKKIQDRSNQDFYYNQSDKIDFLSLFLTYNGYIKQTTTKWKDIDNDFFKTEHDAVVKGNYYMLIEPTYIIYYTEKQCFERNCDRYLNWVYGTSSELAQFMREKIESRKADYLDTKYGGKGGYFAGLSSNFLYNIGCNMSTSKNNSIGYKAINGTQDCNNPSTGLGLYADKYEPREQRLDKMEWIYNRSNLKYSEGYGMYVMKLFGDPETPQQKEELTLNSDLCTKKLGTLTSEIENVTNESLYGTQYFKLSGTSSDVNIFCTDEVEYNFSNIINRISTVGTAKQKPKTIIGKDSVGTAGTLTVNRTCYTDKKVDMKSYNEKTNMFGDVTLHVYDKDYTLKMDNPKITKTGGDKANTKVNYTITADYELEKDIVVTKSGTGYLSFKNVNALYGYNTNLVNKFNYRSSSFNEISQVYDRLAKNKQLDTTYTFNLNTSNGATTKSSLPKQLCEFETNVDDVASNVVFRTIDLKDPFPGRDGTTRMPGKNWINQKNNVDEYITNNRGVKDEEVYNLEPLYTITLTPTDMIKIREENKKENNGYINNHKNCTNGVMCESEFLKSIKGKALKGGTCANIKYTDANEYEKTKCAVDNATGVGCSNYQEAYDTNKDYKIDLNDLEKIQYYSCANKTAASGGYWRDNK